MSFRIKGGAEAAGKFLLAAKLFALAESLGGVESLAEVAAQMSHHVSAAFCFFFSFSSSLLVGTTFPLFSFLCS